MTTKEDLPKDDGFIHIEDDQLVAEVMNVFKWNIQVPEGKVKVTVKEGWVTLEGNLQWDYQKKAAKDDIIKLIGVKGVTNNIRVEREIYNKIEKRNIEASLQQTWALNLRKINVSVSGSTVTLKGTVHSVYQKGLAANIAKMASGVRSVSNEIFVDYAYILKD